ncbi:MAG TPA: SDR family NAD(P)-dependent oxidoreductase [Gammaproteobacteria bacterium]|nr:SDR family NAD(P)-dependent oxidoreductase [Gammaproteobacteria bacterium]
MSNPVCAIVGAGEGLGRALAAKFASHGFDIALVSRSEKHSTVAAEAATNANANVRIQFLAADGTRPATIEKALATIATQMGEIEVLIYNARGSFASREPLELTYEELEDNYRLEVVGAFASAKSVLPAMRERGKGSVFFSSATAAYRGSATHALYAIGKFGLRALSQSLAKAYSKDGVHIVHVRLDCDLDVPFMREIYGDEFDSSQMANTDDVAKNYWWVHQQPRSAWSNELELRPYTEEWTY